MKTETNPLVFKQKLAEFIDSKQTGSEIYSDGSQDKNKVAAAAVIKIKTYFPVDSQMRRLCFQPKQSN